MEPNVTLSKETENFVKASEDIHALLASGPIPTEDRDVLIITAHNLLTELKA